MTPEERFRITANLTQARLSWASDRSRMVEIRRDLMIDLLALVVELEHAQRGT